VNLEIATLKAVPEAGGCSVFVATIIKMERATAREYENNVPCEGLKGIKLAKKPEKRPMMWPPITFLGLDVTFFAIAKTMNGEDPMEAIIIVCSNLRKSKTVNVVKKAKTLWRR